MLILFNKAISVACFAMRCRQFFLLPHFSQSIDADTNVSAAHSLKLQRKIGWDWLWGGNPRCSLDGESFVSALLLSPINVPMLSRCRKGYLTFSVGGRCPCGDTQPCFGCREHCWILPWRIHWVPLQAWGISSTQSCSCCHSKLSFKWGIWN